MIVRKVESSIHWSCSKNETDCSCDQQTACEADLKSAGLPARGSNPLAVVLYENQQKVEAAWKPTKGGEAGYRSLHAKHATFHDPLIHKYTEVALVGLKPPHWSLYQWYLFSIMTWSTKNETKQNVYIQEEVCELVLFFRVNKTVTLTQIQHDKVATYLLFVCSVYTCEEAKQFVKREEIFSTRFSNKTFRTLRSYRTNTKQHIP